MQRGKSELRNSESGIVSRCYLTLRSRKLTSISMGEEAVERAGRECGSFDNYGKVSSIRSGLTNPSPLSHALPFSSLAAHFSKARIFPPKRLANERTKSGMGGEGVTVSAYGLEFPPRVTKARPIPHHNGRLRPLRS